MTPPDNDEIELSLFGPGFGECVVVHAGSSHWAIIDSCIDAANGVPASLYYLHQMALDPKVAVKMVMVTHWHDDHIRGISKVLRACTCAKLVIPSAILTRDFVRAVVEADEKTVSANSSGVHEIRAVFESEQMRNNPVLAGENQIVWSISAADLAHATPFELRALSPSGQQTLSMWRRIGKDFAAAKGRRLPQAGSNDLSIATWMTTAGEAVLLGADLEVHADPTCGWTPVINLAQQLPGTKAAVFKVPHHGSPTGHDPAVWQFMLQPNALSILTPWTRGSGLPRAEDLVRIRQFTNHAYATNLNQMVAVARRDPVVSKTLRDLNIRLEPAEGKLGHVRLRKKPGAPWAVDLFGPASRFSP